MSVPTMPADVEELLHIAAEAEADLAMARYHAVTEEEKAYVARMRALRVRCAETRFRFCWAIERREVSK